MDESMSKSTEFVNRAYSELSTVSQFDQFYSKWEGIIKSGQNLSCNPTSFFDQNARVNLRNNIMI